MTTPGRYAANDGAFAKSAGSAAARGGVLIAVAVILGLIILAVGYDGGDDSAAIGDDPSDDTSADDPSDDTTDSTPADDAPDDDTDGTPGDDTDDAPTDDAPDDDAPDDTDDPPVTTPSARPPGEVKVVVANGVGEPGLAGTTAGVLSTAGYVTEPTNTATKPQTTSQVLWIDGYEEEAKAVADVIGAPASVIIQAPADPTALVEATTVADFHIFVIQGDDRLAG